MPNIQSPNFPEQLKKTGFTSGRLIYTVAVNPDTGECTPFVDSKDLDSKEVLIFTIVNPEGDKDVTRMQMLNRNDFVLQLLTMTHGASIVTEIFNCLSLGIEMAAGEPSGPYIPFNPMKFLDETPVLSHSSLFRPEVKQAAPTLATKSKPEDVANKAEDDAVGPEDESIGPGM